MRNRVLTSLLTASAVLAAAAVYAGCGSCGTHGTAKPAGTSECGAAGACGLSKPATERSCTGGACKVKAAKCGSGQCGAGKKTGCASSMSAATAPAEQEFSEISTATLKVLLSSGAATVLDARTGKWDDGKRIPGAGSLSPEATAAEAAKVIASKDSLVVTYCSNTQCPASHKLAKRLAELGYGNILEYPKGIQGWQAEGNSVTGK